MYLDLLLTCPLLLLEPFANLTERGTGDHQVSEVDWVCFGTSVDGNRMVKASTQQVIAMANTTARAALQTNLMAMRPKLEKDHHYSGEKAELEGGSPSFAMRISASFEKGQSRDLLVMMTIPPHDLLHDILARVPWQCRPMVGARHALPGKVVVHPCPSVVMQLV
jgi:hypothetical protein